MTEQPIEPRERDEEQNPETASPLPDDSSGSEEAADARAQALSGSGVGSDTRAGSLRGGSASGSEIDDDQARIDETLKSEGMLGAEGKSFSAAPSVEDSHAAVNNVGQPNLGPHGDPAEGKRDPAATGGDDADAATG